MNSFQKPQNGWENFPCTLPPAPLRGMSATQFHVTLIHTPAHPARTMQGTNADRTKKIIFKSLINDMDYTVSAFNLGKAS